MKPLKALIVEDSETDEKLLLRQLAKANYDVQSVRVQTAADLENALAEPDWDIVLSDYAMPGFTGLDALRVLKASGRDIPLLIISGTIGEDVAVEAMRIGVSDYLLKGNLARLAPAIERELENSAARRAQKQAEEALRQSEASLANAQRIAHIGSWVWDIQNNQLSWSDEIYRIFGFVHSKFEGTYEAFFKNIHPNDRQKVQAAVDATLTRNAAYNFEHRIIRSDGEQRIVREIGEATFDESGKPLRFIGTVQDITERRTAKTEMRLMKSAIDSIVEGVIISDAQKPDNPIIYTNAAFENLTGYAFEEIKGQNCRFLQGAETNPRTIDEIREAIEKETIFRGEILNYKKNGKSFWNELKISPVFDQSGRLTNFVGVQQDVSERKQAEETLRESEEKYRSIVETANEGIWLTDIETRAIYVNRQMAEMLGYTVEEMLGRPIFDFIFDEDLPAAKHKYKERLDGKSETGEFRMRRKDGSEIITLFNTTPRRNQAGEIVGFLTMRSDITNRKIAERELRYAEAKYRSLIESSPAIVYLSEPHPPYSPIYVSPNIVKFGYTTEEWFNRADMWMSLIHPEDRDRVLRVTANAMRQDLDTDLEYRIIAGNGTIYWLQDRGRFVSDEQGNKTGWQGIMLDITDTKVLEEQLRQSQKLESVGRLAGGIAHDFNNMLTAINGYSELTLRKLEADSPLRRNIEEIKKAGEHSALLTHQLLAFSRQQVLKPVVLDLNEVITDTTKLLERLIGEDVKLVTAFNSKTGRVKADPGQLSQIIMNLSVNARDAMPQGGKLTIETANVFLKPNDVKQKVGVLPGAYVMLAVCDTGNGIDENILPHIFEPFFTTKEVGKGTGLGLATVYGIVKQSGGNIEVDSKQGIGTTFKVFLPRVAEVQVAVKAKDTFTEDSAGTETILLVEDEELVRNLSREILESSGYTVIEARNGLEALEICENGKFKFDLLMTDVVMPQMGGRELAGKLTEKIPDIKILFTSGYTDDAVMRYGVIETNINFLQKPFTFDALAGKVRNLLDE